LDLPNAEPFAAIILATADPQKVDKRTRSKCRACSDMRWSPRQTLNRLPRSFSARAVSTNVLTDLPDDRTPRHALA
jgi:hypothetical protein